MSDCTQRVGIPFEINAGDTVIFTECFTCYPNSAWTLKLWLYLLGGDAPFPTTATNDGTNFKITLTPTVTSALPEGQYEYAEQVTNIADATQIFTAKQGTIQVLPNYMIAQSPTFAQQQVTNLQGALALFSSTDKKSVNFAGQEFERADIDDYRKQIVFWMSRVNVEQAARNRLRGGRDPGRITTQFVPAYCQAPYSYPPHNNGCC